MSSITMPSSDASLLPLSDDELMAVTFVDRDGRYECVNCRRTLGLGPRQTICGHRLCARCVDLLFAKNDSVMCPAGETDCNVITRESVYPDCSVVREMKRLDVYCINRKFGCKATPPYGKLKEHIQVCEFVFKTCAHCQQRIPCSQQDMDEHVSRCPQKPQKCRFHPLGCTHQGPRDDIAGHESDVDKHMKVALDNLLKKDAEIATLSVTQTRLQTHIETLNSTVEELQRQLLKLQDDFTRTIEKQNLEIQNLRATQQRSENEARQVVAIKQSTTLPDELRKHLSNYERVLSDIDLRCQCLETTNYDGVLIWKIGDYTDRKRQAVEGKILSLYSQPFYTSRYGYKMCARVYLNGDGVGKGTHVSLFFVVMQGDYDELLSWPFRQRVTFSLMDQRSNKARHHSETFRPDPTSASFQKPTTPMNVASGCPLFVAHSQLEASDGVFLRNNYIYIKVVVDTSDLLNP